METAFLSLKPGQIFRLFEEDGHPVVAEDRVWRWRVLGPVTQGEDGKPIVDAEPIPESEAERQVQQTGMYWPGGGTEFQRPWTPGRLR